MSNHETAGSVKAPRGGNPTLRDVAKLAGVSPFTVSTVLNGARSSTRVSDATRERIHAAAKELGYRPNALARSLQSRRTNIIGLYFGYGSLEPHDPFHAEVLTGLQRGCEAFRKDLMIHYSFHKHSVDEVFSELAGGKIDGLVLLTSSKDPLVARVRYWSSPSRTRSRGSRAWSRTTRRGAAELPSTCARRATEGWCTARALGRVIPLDVDSSPSRPRRRRTAWRSCLCRRWIGGVGSGRRKRPSWAA